MWTYRNEKTAASVGQTSRFPGNPCTANQTNANVPFVEKAAPHTAHGPVTTIGKASFAQRAIYPKKRLSAFYLGGLLYLIGIFLGAIWRPGPDSWLQEYAQHYAESQITRYLECQAGMIFCAQFLALLMQLLLATLAGFCAFGVLLLPVIILLKGIGAGFFSACLYLEYGLMKGAGMELLFFLLPQLFGLFLLLSQSAAAWKLSRELLAVCTHNRGVRSTAESKRVLNRLLLCCTAALVPAVLSSLCSVLFAGLFTA